MTMTGGRSLSNADHLQTLSKERCDRKKYQDIAHKSRLEVLVWDIKGNDKRLLLRAKSTGAWMSVRGTIVSGTALSATESQDFLCARYNFSPVNHKSHCDRCGTAFGVTHALSWSIGGLVIVFHKKIRDKILYLSRREFASAYVRA